MLSTNYFVHLFFDFDHDTHYTDTLLALESQAYLWYRLKINYGFDAALFFDRECEDLIVQTFDGFSKQLAEKKGLFDLVLKRSEDFQEIESCTQTLRKDFSFDDILKTIDRKELKGKKIAFVLSLPALNLLYEKSDEKTIDRLKKKIENPDGKSIMVIKIPPVTAKIREAFLGENAVLPMISRKTAAVLNGAQEPLTDALRRQMKEQIVYGYRIDDAFNMLLKIAAEKSDWTDSLEDMRKQAEYLQLSCNICGSLVYEQRRDGASSMFMKHRELYEQLKNSDIKQLVRNEIKKLESKYQGFTVGDAMREEKLLPKKELCYPAVLENDDPIVRNIKTLSISENFEKCYEYEKWCEQLERIKKNFSTFWNKPLNCLSYSKAEEFYNYARKACINGDKNTFNDALEMLSFCGELICAGEDKCENLAVILDYGKSIVELSENIFNILKKYNADDVYEFTGIYEEISAHSKESFGIENKIDMEIDKNNLAGYQQSRYILKFHVGRLKNEIKLNRISKEEMEKVRRTIEKEMNAQIETASVFAQESHAAADYTKTTTEQKLSEEAKTKAYEEEEDIESFLYETEADEPDDSVDYNRERKIKDENFAEKLYKKTLYKDM